MGLAGLGINVFCSVLDVANWLKGPRDAAEWAPVKRYQKQSDFRIFD